MDVKLNYSSLYNAMIHPFTRMTIYGAIWYQGKTGDGYPMVGTEKEFLLFR